MSRRDRPANRYGCKPDHDVCVAHDLPLIGAYWCEKSWRHKTRPEVDNVYVKAAMSVSLGIGDHRRVIGIGSYVNKAGKTIERVCYSNGGNINHWCNLDTFMEWIKDATLTKKGRTVESSPSTSV